MENKVILLDLNQTLAGKISMDYQTFSYDVSQDEYREDLVKALEGKRVFLITARTGDYAKQTMEKIKNDTTLVIERSYFKPKSMQYTKVYDFKRLIVLDLFKEGFKADDFFGIESNRETRDSYASIGVQSCTYAEYMKRYAGNGGNQCQEINQTKLF